MWLWCGLVCLGISYLKQQRKTETEKFTNLWFISKTKGLDTLSNLSHHTAIILDTQFKHPVITVSVCLESGFPESLKTLNTFSEGFIH